VTPVTLPPPGVMAVTPLDKKTTTYDSLLAQVQ